MQIWLEKFCDHFDPISQCACTVVNGTSVLCCNPTNSSNLCIDQADIFEPISSVSIIFTAMTKLSLTEDVWPRLGVKDISQLIHLRIGNSSIEKLNICQNRFDPVIVGSVQIPSDSIRRSKRFISQQLNKSLNDHSNGVKMNEDESNKNNEEETFFNCEDFVSLNKLDVSGNQLKLLNKMNFPNLKQLHISGKTTKRQF